MNLLTQAEQDLSVTLEDKISGFGKSVVFVDKIGTRFGDADELIAKVQDIGFFIDPGNDVGVQARTVWIELRLSTLISEGVGIPKAKDGWEIIVADSQGNDWSFAIEMVSPDRTLGIIKFHLLILDKS